MTTETENNMNEARSSAAHCSAARDLACELAQLLADAEMKSPYPYLMHTQKEDVIFAFLQKHGLVQPNAEVSDQRGAGSLH